MRKHLAWAVPAAASLGLALPLQPCWAADAATIGLDVEGLPKVIIGTQVPISATVYNLAAAGSNDLQYRIDWSLADGTQYSSANNALAPGDDYAWDALTFDTNTTGYGLWVSAVTVTDPQATNSPMVATYTTNVVDHAVPMWFTTVNGVATPRPAQEPQVDPLAFGATGGGESFAAPAVGIVGDPEWPTAGLDLDSISESGDAQLQAVFRPAGCVASSPEYADLTCGRQDMSTFLASFKNLVEIHEASGLYGTSFDDPDNPAPANLYEQYGRWFNILVDTSVPGVFSKTWTLGFSDEGDILGGNEFGSVTRSITYTAYVYATPVPASAWLFGSGLVGLLSFWRRGRARNPRQQAQP